MNDPAPPVRPLGLIEAAILLCGCFVAYLITMILLIVIGVNGKVAHSMGAAIGWFIGLSGFARRKLSNTTPRIAAWSIFIGFSYYAQQILVPYLKSLAGK